MYEKEDLLRFSWDAFFSCTALLFYMEFRFGTTTVVSQNISPEGILQEMPDIAVTSEEMAMAKALSQTREMEDAFLQAESAENEIFEFSMADAENLLQAYIPRGWNVLELTVLPKSAYLGFSKGKSGPFTMPSIPQGKFTKRPLDSMERTSLEIVP